MTLIVVRRENRDASAVAAETAREHGTKLSSGLRWYGAMGPAYREALTADGRTIRVTEFGDPMEPGVYQS